MAQSVHAAIIFAKEWLSLDEACTVVCLGARDETHLESLYWEIRLDPTERFCEPDLDDALTSIATVADTPTLRKLPLLFSRGGEHP